MTEEITVQRKICDGCGKADIGPHAAAGHFDSSWSNVRGFDVCPVCEIKLKHLLAEKAKLIDIETILDTFTPSDGLETFGTFRPLSEYTTEINESSKD